MRLVTWNINSVRLRLGLLLKLIEQTDPDVLVLQETKVENAGFPLRPLAEFGYVHTHLAGMKAYNGVAILSRLPLSARTVPHWCGRQDCRHVAAVVADALEVHCLYVPSGGDVPDAEANPKFAHKLQFLDEMIGWWSAHRAADRPMLLAGDLNIAPLEHDVWSHKEMVDVVSHTPVEVAKLNAMQEGLRWIDIARHFIPPEQKLYTWWSYRAKDWQKSDRGRRLDHIWITRPLIPALTGFSVLAAARGWGPRPSDHVPVLADLSL